MMRNLAAMGETYAQTAIEDSSAWSLWPLSSAEASSSATASGSRVPPVNVPPVNVGTFPARIGGSLHMRTASQADQIANILSMAETVREVLPHIPDELIFQVILHFDLELTRD